MNDVAIVAVAWIAWGAFHSLLITPAIRDRLAPSTGKWFRILYNGFATVTLFAAAAVTWRYSGAVVFDWWGWWIPASVILATGAVLLFWAGSGTYDMSTFLGLRQLRDGEHRQSLGEGGDLQRQGIHGLTRHPWYAATLMLLWVGPRSTAWLTVSVVLTAYVLVGTWLEERKLVVEFGESYRDYQREVPMLVPWKALFRRGSPGAP